MTDEQLTLLRGCVAYARHFGEWCDTRKRGEAVAEALAEIERLRAVVDRLPSTADGVPVTPGMTVYLDGGVEGVVLYVIDFGFYVRNPGGIVLRDASSAWSTSEAAAGGSSHDSE